MRQTERLLLSGYVSHLCRLDQTGSLWSAFHQCQDITPEANNNNNDDHGIIAAIYDHQSCYSKVITQAGGLL